jgi:hypothetical protein
MLSDEDRQAFHNQADRVLSEVGIAEEIRRVDTEDTVRVYVSSNGEMPLAILVIRPRHRFTVEGMDGTRETVYRRPDACRFLSDVL